MDIAFTMSPGRGDTDRLLQRLAQALTAKGLRVCGVVQVNSERDDCDPCDMDIQVIPDGPLMRISQSLGRESRGCRLNPAALEEGVAAVGSRLTADMDLLLLNKFGKHEAEGRGFRDLIGQALIMGVPVVTGVNNLNLPAFDIFTDGAATRVPPELDALENWVDRVHARRRQSA